MRWAVVVACIACIAALGAAALAVASARVEQIEVRFGFVAELTGAGCVSGTLARSAEGNQPLRFDPAIGDEVGYLDSVVVTAATLDGGQVSWTTQPTATTCASYDGDPSWTWS